jgi:hypothetical protein
MAAEDDDDLSLVECRPHRKTQLPMRFRDDVPQPLPLLPPTADGLGESDAPTTSHALFDAPSSSSVLPTRSFQSRIRQLFCTPKNIFGLFRQYRSKNLPSHDPEEHVELQDLYDPTGEHTDPPGFPNGSNLVTDQSGQLQSKALFYPYSNKSSFLLGDWYWNNGGVTGSPGASVAVA